MLQSSSEIEIIDYYNLDDEELVVYCKDSEKAASVLISRYAKIVRAKAVFMSNNAVDADDLMQEGLLGLLNAIKSYEQDIDVQFSTYSNICITNKMKTALIKSNRQDIPIDEVDKDVEKADNLTPESILIEKEKTKELDYEISSLLSTKEWQIFRLFLRGSTYDQMARQLNISPKTVDNALQRVRRKLKLVWRADHFSV